MTTSTPYLRPLLQLFAANANAENAAPMARYMRDQFPFYGLKTPERKALLKQFLADYGRPALEELPNIARLLWAESARECQYTAVDLLRQQQRHLPPDTAVLIEELVVNKSWWDTIDPLASPITGTLFQHHPAVRDATIARWRTSDNFWLRRMTLLFQRHYKQETDEALLFNLIRDNLGSDEFFINKAIGWALREYSKVNPTAVVSFVNETDLAPLSRREGLKWLTKHQPHILQESA